MADALDNSAGAAARNGPDPITGRIIAAAIAVHKARGPDLLESAHEACLAREMNHDGLSFERQTPLPVTYRGETLDCGYRLDFVVEGRVIVELKSVEALMPIHEVQMLTYLRLSGKPTGLLINFNTPYLRDGVKRLSL